MKIELKHLAGYELGNKGIKVIINEDGLRELWDIECDNSYLTEPYYIKSIDYDLKVLQLVSVKNENYSLDEIELEWINLICFPLSDLIKEIEVNIGKFVPLIELLRLSNFDVSRMKTKEQLEFEQVFCNMDFISFKDAQKLLEWHFDIYGLIENNLAIDINTLNK